MPRWRAPQEQRVDQLDRDAALRVRDELAFVKHDQAELGQKPRRSEREIQESLVGEEAEVVTPGEHGPDTVGGIPAATDHPQTGWRVALGELFEFLVDQRSIGQQESCLLPGRDRLNRRHLADHRLAGACGRDDQQRVAGEHAELVDRSEL